jgi:hypothetical protein
VVRDTEVVVDGLRDVEALHLVALFGGILVDEVRSLSGVVAADVEEVLDVELLEHRDHGCEVLFGRLHAHGAEGSGGDFGDGGEVLGRLLAEVDQVLVQQALDAVAHAKDTSDVVMLQSLGDEADQRLVDHHGWAAGLADHRGARQCESLRLLLLRGRLSVELAVDELLAWRRGWLALVKAQRRRAAAGSAGMAGAYRGR